MIKNFLELKNILILVILIFGVGYKLLLTSNGNFIFNMDNARDFVDVREMVELKQIRLSGPTSGIEGLYNGPLWYYLLAIPYIVLNGDPYGGVLMMIIFWTIGGYFLLKMVSRWGAVALFIVGLVWVSSNFVNLATSYSFNPSPVLLLMPVFIYTFSKYLDNSKFVYSVVTMMLAASFFHFEMAFGIFMPLVIFMTMLVTGKLKYIFSRNFLFGVFVFILLLGPQIIFDIRHEYIMSNSVLKYLSESTGLNTDFVRRGEIISDRFFSVISAVFMNWKLMTQVFLVSLFLLIWSIVKDKHVVKDNYMIIAISIVVTTYVGYILLPINVMPWHIGGIGAALVLLVGYLLYYLSRVNVLGKIISLIFMIAISYYSVNNLNLYENLFKKEPSNDPSVFRNELAAVDYIYNFADGKNFKAYAYLPSVIDYPYQYIFWWRGLGKYGYVPEDYAYQPDKPPYIKNKELLRTGSKPESSGFTFLIKEPDRIGQRHLWENYFNQKKLIKSDTVGPLIVEVRRG